jgi:hypothetical protein
MNPVFRRGFVEEVTVRVNLFQKYAAALFEAAPIRTLHLQTGGARSVYLVGTNLSALAASPHLARLADLDLSNNRVLRPKLRLLLNTPFLKNLRALDVRGLALAHSYIGTITEAPFLTNLKRLDLRENDLGPAAIRRLAEWPGLARLTWLDLRDNPVGNAGAQLLAASPHLGDDLVVYVSHCGIGPSGQKTLVQRLGSRVRFDS